MSFLAVAESFPGEFGCFCLFCFVFLTPLACDAPPLLCKRWPRGVSVVPAARLVGLVCCVGGAVGCLSGGGCLVCFFGFGRVCVRLVARGVGWVAWGGPFWWGLVGFGWVRVSPGSGGFWGFGSVGCVFGAVGCFFPSLLRVLGIWLVGGPLVAFLVRDFFPPPPGGWCPLVFSPPRPLGPCALCLGGYRGFVWVISVGFGCFVAVFGVFFAFFWLKAVVMRFGLGFFVTTHNRLSRGLLLICCMED